MPEQVSGLQRWRLRDRWLLARNAIEHIIVITVEGFLGGGRNPLR